MKLIHLSDLHLGKRLLEVSLIEDQAYILTQIIHIIDEEKPDAVLICGDVYDKSIPSAEAVQLFDDFLYRLSQRKVHVLIISGNHDSAERLSFGGRLLDVSGIHISPVYDGTVEPIILEDAYGEVRFYMLPFIKPAQVKRFYEEEGIDSYTDAVRAAVKHMKLDRSSRNVLLTHQFVTGAHTCESEEIFVGGSDNVDASVFEDFDYVALGHIHGPQNICSEKMRYCGTPLKYSFSEVNHTKSVTVVELSQKGVMQMYTVDLHPMHEMRKLKGKYGELTAQSAYKGTAVEDYLHITLTDEEDVPEAMGRLRVIYPNLLSISYDNARTRRDTTIECAERVQHKSPLELFEELYELQNNQPMTDVQRHFVQDLIESIKEDEL